MFTTKGELTYCTNIHAGESWEEHFLALDKHFPVIKSQVSPFAPMGLGLRLSHIASMELVKKDNLLVFQDWLATNNAYVFTINGFPYGGFHNTAVKEKVHLPDWSTRERVDYTLRLFDILGALLPEHLDGGVSTSPLSYRHWFTTSDELAAFKQVATDNILLIAEQLISIHRTTGKLIHLDIEPEPDGVLENGPEFIDWFLHDLLKAGIPLIATKCGVSETEAEDLIKTHIRLCYDVCHFAIGYESHATIIHQLALHKIKIGKLQISAALKANLPPGEKGRTSIKNAFGAFNESTYLHQVIGRLEDQTFLRYPDLPQALLDVQNQDVREWRAHFHVPIFEKDFGILQSTQADISEVLKLQQHAALTKHLEVETYTWEVLGEEMKLPLQESIIRELQWVVKELG
ncbi:MAG: metabolite traffic protein EboE [Chitinophagaceae bacterium]